MHRVDAPGNVGNLYTDGNPAIGQQATQVRAAHLNDIQENICTVIEDAGIALVKGDASQLSAAIAQLISDAADALFTSGSNSDGHWRQMPDGAGGFIIEQWGRIAVNKSTGTYNLTFPIPFETGCENIVYQTINSDSSGLKDMGVHRVSENLTTATYFIDATPIGGSVDLINGVDWRAIGR